MFQIFGNLDIILNDSLEMKMQWWKDCFHDLYDRQLPLKYRGVEKMLKIQGDKLLPDWDECGDGDRKERYMTVCMTVL